MATLRLAKRLSAWILTVCGLIAGLYAGPAWAAEKPEPKKAIAVVEFAVRGSAIDPQAGAIIADSITSAIASLGYFALKDRLSLSAIARIARHNPLGSIGPIDAETAMQLGKLHGIHGIVTGTISQLGDRVRVTARLIDTRNGTVLRSGEIEDKDLDAVQVKLDKLVLAITTTTVPATAPLRALTVKTEPVNAQVRLLNVSHPYQPGLQLPSGVYEIEVSHPGYVMQRIRVKIADNDVTLLMTLEKARYALTVDVEPPQSQLRILNFSKPYQPGMKLEAGVYEIEVTCPGYRSKTYRITLTDADLDVVVKLEPQSEEPEVLDRPPLGQILNATPVRPAKKSASSSPRSKVIKNSKPSSRQTATARAETRRIQEPKQPAPNKGGAFKQAVRKFKDDFKKAFW